MSDACAMDNKVIGSKYLGFNRTKKIPSQLSDNSNVSFYNQARNADLSFLIEEF